MTSSYFYISSVVFFDNIRQTSIKCLYINALQGFKAHVLNYVISVPNCQKVPIFKHFRHFSTHSVLKYHCSTKCIRSMLVLILYSLFIRCFALSSRIFLISYAIANWLRVCSTSALIRLIMFNSSSLV